MLHSGNDAFYCAFVIVKLSGRFCVKPIYAHVSRFARDPLLLHVPAYVMLPRIIPRNFLRLHTRRNKKETANNGARHCGTICVGAKCSFTLTRRFLRRIAQIFVYRSIELVICETKCRPNKKKVTSNLACQICRHVHTNTHTHTHTHTVF